MADKRRNTEHIYVCSIQIKIVYNSRQLNKLDLNSIPSLITYNTNEVFAIHARNTHYTVITMGQKCLECGIITKYTFTNKTN